MYQEGQEGWERYAYHTHLTGIMLTLLQATQMLSMRPHPLNFSTCLEWLQHLHNPGLSQGPISRISQCTPLVSSLTLVLCFSDYFFPSS
jgi:hypothetical protein